MDDQDIDEMIIEPNTCAVPLLWLILSDFQHVVQYVTALLGEIEWEIALPAMRQNPKVDATMQKLHPWRRNVTLYKSMVSGYLPQASLTFNFLVGTRSNVDTGMLLPVGFPRH